MRYLFVLFLLFTALFTLQRCGKTTHQQGRNLYQTHCSNCHMEDGGGLRQLIPPLAGADYLKQNPAAVVQGIVYGMKGPLIVNGISYNHPMPGNKELTEFQIVNIVNYINQAWGNNYGLITVEDARKWMKPS